jgi:hypothetical protein
MRIASASDIAGFFWKDRGVAPAGYINGTALVYARAYCKLKAGDAARSGNGESEDRGCGA